MWQIHTQILVMSWYYDFHNFLVMFEMPNICSFENSNTELRIFLWT